MLEFLKAVLWAKMETPTMYSWFHLLMLALCLGGCALVVIFRKKIDERRFRIMTGIFLAVVVALEIVKQINFSYNPETDKWAYQWYAFPFQFCSSPYFVWPFVLFVKNEKVKKCLYAFIGTFNFFGGLVNMFYPATVFIGDVVINIQTQVHHGLMLVLGVAVYACGLVEKKPKALLDASIVFGVLIAVAIVLNEVMYPIVGQEHSFNMFYISRHYDCSLPLLEMFWKVENPPMPYICFLLIYIVGFVLIGAIIFYSAQGIAWLANKFIKKEA